ncbi:RecX family transcriptional regulator [Fulvivirgaceae bacterium BMA10]|uniref:Regulatory protein RecX n=1 Tax=Splendidivirga corallicola TaxID=3051826 RepID=A0ABT8KT94_9BACT|nr:RecX family transcriptional regulator [Fulvivirgaceae bacterium BMA10]
MAINEENTSRQRSVQISEAKLRAANFCAYQERTQQQVRDKLYGYGLHRDDVEEIIAELILENFINEERFAKSYVGGKFRVKKWGKLKIRQNLESMKLSNYCIKKGMEEIDELEYQKTLEYWLYKKLDSLNEPNEFRLKHKVSQFLIGKGFEPELIWKMLEEKIP